MYCSGDGLANDFFQDFIDLSSPTEDYQLKNTPLKRTPRGGKHWRALQYAQHQTTEYVDAEEGPEPARGDSADREEGGESQAAVLALLTGAGPFKPCSAFAASKPAPQQSQPA